MKWGISILSLYLIWSLSWLVGRHFFWGSPSDPLSPSMDMSLELVGLFDQGFILGTDIYGRSLLQVLSMGLNYSLLVSGYVSFLSALFGLLIGYLSASESKWVSTSFDLLTNLIFVFPSILIAIMIMSVTGQSMKGLVFALVITGWPGYARIVRGETLRVRNLPYVESAKAIGVRKWRLFWTAIFPAILPVILIHLILGLSGVIISEATLGFLGLGGSEYSWGAMLGIAKTVLLEAPQLTIILSLAMGGLILGLNLLGDGLRDYLDPKNQ